MDDDDSDGYLFGVQVTHSKSENPNTVTEKTKIRTMGPFLGLLNDTYKKTTIKPSETNLRSFMEIMQFANKGHGISIETARKNLDTVPTEYEHCNYKDYNCKPIRQSTYEYGERKIPHFVDGKLVRE